MKKTKRARSKQLELFNSRKAVRLFGGSLLKGNPKTKRPLSTKEAVHLVLKSKQAIGPNSMLQKRNAQIIEKLIRQTAKDCFISIYYYVNVGNHLHMVIRLKDVLLYSKFIRAITGLIARHVMQKERGCGLKFVPENFRKDLDAVKQELAESFWIARPFTRLIAWGRDYQAIKKYMDRNKAQASPRTFFTAWGFDILDHDKIRVLNTG